MTEIDDPRAHAVPTPPSRMVVGAVIGLAGACIGFTAGYLVGREKRETPAIVTGPAAQAPVPTTPVLMAPVTPAPAPPAVPPPAAPDPEVKARHDAEVDRWIRQLKSPDPNAGDAFTATYKLKDLNDLRAVPALVEALQGHEDYYTRLGAASALGLMKACDAVPALIEAFDDREELVKAAALDALGNITGRDTEPAPNAANAAGKPSKEDWTNWWKQNEARVRRGLGQAK